MNKRYHDLAEKALEVLKDIVMTIPENERPRMLGIMIDDLNDSASRRKRPEQKSFWRN